MKKKIFVFTIAASLLFIAFILYLLLGGRFARGALKNAINNQFLETGEVNMSEATSFDWDFMYVFGPYVSEKYIDETLGFDDWDDDGPLYDDLQLILFVKNNTIIQHVTMGRNPDLVFYSGQGYTPDDAIFTFTETDLENHGNPEFHYLYKFYRSPPATRTNQ